MKKRNQNGGDGARGIWNKRKTGIGASKKKEKK